MSHPMETFASSQIDLHKLFAVSDSWVVTPLIGDGSRSWILGLRGGKTAHQSYTEVDKKNLASISGGRPWLLGYQEGLQSAAVQQLLCGRKEQADPKLIVCVCLQILSPGSP